MLTMKGVGLINGVLIVIRQNQRLLRKIYYTNEVYKNNLLHWIVITALYSFHGWNEYDGKTKE